MPKLTWWAAALVLLSASVGRDGIAFAKAAKGGKPAPARERACVKLSEAELPTGDLELRLDNTCSASRECEIRWTLTCEGKAPLVERFTTLLLSGTDERWTVAISSCGDAAYRVSAPVYQCRAPKPSAAEAAPAP